MPDANLLSAEPLTVSHIVKSSLARLFLHLHRQCKPQNVGGPDETIRGLSSLIAAQKKQIADLEAEVARLKQK
jgi:hypothetical protein